MVEGLEVLGEAHAVGGAGVVDHDGQATVGVHAVEDAVAAAAGHCAAEDAAGGVGDDVVKAAGAFGRDFVDQILEGLAFAPEGDAAAGHEEEQGAIFLDGEAADGFAGVEDKAVRAGGGVVAVEFAGGMSTQ